MLTINNDRTEKTLCMIYQTLSDYKKLYRNDHGALLNSAGLALFFLNFYKTYGKDEAYNIVEELIEKTISQDIQYSEEKNGSTTFCSGIIGLGWLHLNLWQNNFKAAPLDLSELDEIALAQFNRWIEEGNYDYLHGAGGALFYMLNRHQTKKVKDKVAYMLGKILSLAADSKDHFYWPAYDLTERKIEADTINFGLSHGTPSMLSILSKAFVKNNSYDLYTKIKKCANTLIECQYNGNNTYSYPYSKKINDFAYQPSRLAWCYGDLGVAISLWNAGTSIKDNSLKSEAIKIVKKSCNIRSLAEAEIVDAALCHGAAGVAHIYYKFYQYTALPEFLFSSNYWLEQTFELLSPTDKNPMGKISWNRDYGYLNNFSLLEGLSGIGLSLLTRVSDKPLNWDESLLIQKKKL